jgi:lysophospholipase L1-like esterase
MATEIEILQLPTAEVIEAAVLSTAANAATAEAAVALIEPGVPGGVATLDVDGAIPESQVPARLSVGSVEPAGLSTETLASLSNTIGTAVEDALTTQLPGGATLYEPTPYSLLKWRLVLDAVYAGERQAHIAVPADSIGFGAAAFGNSNPKYASSWPGQLRAELDNELGPAGTGMVLCNWDIHETPAYDDRWTFGGTVTDQIWGFHRHGAFRINTPSQGYIEFTAYCDEFVLYYFDGASLGYVSIDGGADVSFANDISTSIIAAATLKPETGYHAKHGVTRIPAGTLGVHTLRIHPNYANGTTSVDVFPWAVEGRINTPGTLRVSNLGISGKSLDMLMSEATNDEVNGFYGLPLIDSTRADLLAIALGVNDFQSGRPVADSKALLKALVQRQRSNGTNSGGGAHANGDAILIWNPEPQSALGAGAELWAAYRAMFYEVAREENVALLDLGYYWGGYTIASALGVLADTIHPTDKGSRNMVAKIKPAILAGTMPPARARATEPDPEPEPEPVADYTSNLVVNFDGDALGTAGANVTTWASTGGSASTVVMQTRGANGVPTVLAEPAGHKSAHFVAASLQQLAASASIAQAAPMTVCMLVRLTALTGTTQTLLTATGTSRYSTHITASAIPTMNENANSTLTTLAGAAVAAGAWMFLAFRMDADGALFINGTKYTGTIGTDGILDTLIMGAGSSGSSAGLNGDVASMRIYSRALSDLDINGLRASLAAAKGVAV